MILWVFSALILCALGSNKVCPGGSFSCPDTATCCQLGDKSYGCCPLKDAVCCDDHIHCCPQGSKCSAGICIQSFGGNATAKRLTVREKEEDITCFGSQFVCPDKTTCCKGQTPDTYGCCPMEHAVCCSDGYHCCPEGTVCDLKAESCVREGSVSKMYDSQKHRASYMLGISKYFSMEKSTNISVGSVICAGGTFQCPNGYTCCQLPSGNWGCCPFVQATCCSDKLHCCPQNMKCDPASQVCSQGKLSAPSLLKILAKPVNAPITCPDNSTCDETMTCCELSDTSYGCCLYRDGVCCEDRRHCCPNGFYCDDEEKACIPKHPNAI